jgi:AmmeMemoRadiSam system protein B
MFYDLEKWRFSMEDKSSHVRPAAVASMFYPGHPQGLREEVRVLLEQAPDFPGLVPKAMIVPHAGYVYSGPVAARAYKILKAFAKRIRRVVLLGPAHRVYVKGLIVPTSHCFATPLGEVRLDEGCLKDLVRDFAWVQVLDLAHSLEHSLEVQLPFLQEVLDDFVLLPLVVGETPAPEVARVLARLWGGEETLILVSSDLSHYHDYETACRVDGETAFAIENLDTSGITPKAACGAYPLRGLLLAAQSKGLCVHRLGLCNSGDTAGDRKRVVGYGAWLFAEKAP